MEQLENITKRQTSIKELMKLLVILVVDKMLKLPVSILIRIFVNESTKVLFNFKFQQILISLMIGLIFRRALSECFQHPEGENNVKPFLEPVNIFNVEFNEMPSNERTEITNEQKSDEVTDKILTTDDSDINTLKEKRYEDVFRHSSPCSCEFEFNLLDLGPSSYPRYHQQKVCSKNPRNPRNQHCTFGSKCKELEHKVLVLTEMTEESNSDGFFNYEEKKFNWTLVEIKVDCRCTHS